jgi:23S rRNA pseudouridine1911/1915/1917 synthase
MTEALQHTVTPEEQGERLDVLLSVLLPDWTRSRVKTAIAEGHARIDGSPASKAGTKVAPGQCIDFDPPPPPSPTAEPQAIPLRVVYEDEHLLVIDKQAGLVVHPAAGNPDGTLVNALLHHTDALSSVGGGQRPGIVHRLDKDTSGLLVIARTDAAHRHLASQLEQRTLVRVYLALVLGTSLDEQGELDTPYGRHPHDRVKFSSRVDRGRRAVTQWRVLARGALCSLVGVRLKTGRTHQIRVHFADVGHPVAGDPLYGRAVPNRDRALYSGEADALRGLGRQALHATLLGIVHPATGEPMRFASRPPSDFMDAVLAALGPSAVGEIETLIARPARD